MTEILSAGCNICSENNSHVLFEMDGYTYSICKNCSHVFQSNRKLEEHYHSLPYESRWDEYHLHSYNRATYIYDFCKEYTSTADNLIDIGCGSGGPLFYLKDKFNSKNVIGLTLESTSDLKINPFKTEVNIKYCDFLKFTEIEKYNIAIMSHCLEHFIYPMEAISKLRQVLKCGSYAYIEVPSFMWGEIRSSPLYSSVHLSYFSKNQLELMLLNNGFEVLKSKESKYWGNIKILARKSKYSNFSVIRENWKCKLVKKAIIKYLMFPVIKILRKLKKVNPND